MITVTDTLLLLDRPSTDSQILMRSPQSAVTIADCLPLVKWVNRNYPGFDLKHVTSTLSCGSTISMPIQFRARDL